MIEKNNTLVNIPPDRKVIVVYDGSINKNKAKFVGYSILIGVVPWKIWRVLQDIVLVLVQAFFHGALRNKKLLQSLQQKMNLLLL